MLNSITKAHIRKLHFQLAPFMVFPLILSLLTGSAFQMAAATGNANDFLWLLEWHRGKFGQINLENIYPFLNALGLLLVAVSGIMTWFQMRSRRKA